MISLEVNGQRHVFDGDPSMPLILYLRDILNMKTIRLGCLMASCKSCVLYVNEVRCLGCSVTMAEVDSKFVTTVPEW